MTRKPLHKKTQFMHLLSNNKRYGQTQNRKDTNLLARFNNPGLVICPDHPKHSHRTCSVPSTPPITNNRIYLRVTLVSGYPYPMLIPTAP